MKFTLPRNRGSGFGSALILVWAVLIAPLPGAWAWGPEAHQVVGYIADLHLAPATRNTIGEHFNIKSLADVSLWADWVRKERGQGPWHYVNIAENAREYQRDRDCPTGDCVVEKIKEFARTLGDKDRDLRERKEALQYLVHFVGDVHQPLHVGRASDRGGNKIILPYKGEMQNLHSLWDTGLVPGLREDLVQYAASLDARASDEDVREWSVGDPEAWANESYRFAVDHAYRVGGRLDKEYIRKSGEIIEMRLIQAGIRLAQLLNRLMD